MYASDEMSRIIDKYKDLIILNKPSRSCSSSRRTVVDIPLKSDPLEQFLLGSEQLNSGHSAAAHSSLPPQSFSGNSTNQYGGHLLSDAASDKSSILGLEDSQSVGDTDEIFPTNNQTQAQDLHLPVENLLLGDATLQASKDIFSGLNFINMITFVVILFLNQNKTIFFKNIVFMVLLKT